ncbi:MULTISPECIES: acyltransferase family protein [unclassified Sinorhizobium]|uniref:acyltransferase family protein n=1 Tax=unclassified Sinorhizobium TaxID=2613772 RepID=UPI00352681AB
MPGRLPYRADIDGLRAIAILPVVLYHAKIPGFAGGFVGVDVFFVISGFLMASLIGGEIARGEFSLLRFYERRIRRIFPALFAMLALTAVVAWFLFMPVELEYFAESIRAAALFFSNIQFKTESGYFDIGAEMKPLLHTWSLAVEEQFYILFPLLLLALGRLDRRRTAAALIGLFVLSFAASAWYVFASPVSAFYLSQFRAWELLLGAILALGVVPAPSRPFVRQALAALGIALIALAVFVYDERTPFPGLAALVPCLGAGLIIHAGAGADRQFPTPIGRALQAPALVFIGLISYSLYLWHWPLIVFTRYITGHDLTPVEGGAIVIASIALATISWHFIERPFRGHGGFSRRLPLFATAAAVTAIAVAFGSHVIGEAGVPDRLPPSVQKVYDATYDNSRFGGPDCFIETDGTGPTQADVRAGRFCELGRKGAANPAFLVWGDSHSGAMAPAIDVAASEAGVTGLLAAHASCPPLPGVTLTSHGGTRRCEEFNTAVRDLITRRHIPLVFLIAYWPKYVHQSELPNQGVYFDPSVPPPIADKSASITQSLDRLMADLKRQGTKVVLVMDVPEMGHYVPEAMAKAMIKGASTDVAPPWDYIAERQALSRAILARFAKKYGATIVDPLPAFCGNDRCNAARNGIPLYRDSDHITATAARSLSYLYRPLFSPQVSQVSEPRGSLM